MQNTVMFLWLYITGYIFPGFTILTPFLRTHSFLWTSLLTEVAKGCTWYSNGLQTVKRTVGNLFRKTKWILAKLSTTATKCNAYEKEIKVICSFEKCIKQYRSSHHIFKWNCELFQAIFQIVSEILFCMLLYSLIISICSFILSS